MPQVCSTVEEEECQTVSSQQCSTSYSTTQVNILSIIIVIIVVVIINNAIIAIFIISIIVSIMILITLLRSSLTISQPSVTIEVKFFDPWVSFMTPPPLPLGSLYPRHHLKIKNLNPCWILVPCAVPAKVPNMLNWRIICGDRFTKRFVARLLLLSIKSFTPRSRFLPFFAFFLLFAVDC